VETVKKIRSDSLFAKLTESQRSKVLKRLRSGESYHSIRELCAAWGIKTSTGALVNFFQQSHSGNIAKLGENAPVNS
jgi:hypothetical protein